MEIIYYLFLIYITAVYGNPCSNQTLNTVPHPYNCNTFIVCWMSKPYFQACPIGLLFDTTKNNCQPWPIAICCNFIYPKLRRILPPIPSRPTGTLVKRILPPIPDIFVTKLIPENIATIFASTKTLPPINSTSETKGDNGMTGETSVESGDSKVSSVTEINSTVTEPSTGTGTLASISASENTVPSIISTSETIGSTDMTGYTSVESSNSKVSSITEINSNVTEANTVPGTLMTVTSSEKQTLSPISPTSEGNGVTAITDDKSVETTTTIVSSVIVINSTVTKPSTQTGTLTTISASKNSVPPIIFTSDTKSATAISDNKAPESTISIMPNITEINSSVTETNTVPGTLATVSSSKKRTLSPINPTSEGNGATAITDDKYVKSHTSVESIITEINSTVSEPSTETGTLATISVNKNTVSSIYSTSETKRATGITGGTKIESNNFKVSSITEIHSMVTDLNTVPETLATVASSKQQTLPTPSSTSETTLVTSLSGDASVELDLIDVSSITEIYSMITDLKTVPVTLGEDGTSEQQTLSPISLTSEANAATFMTHDTSVESDSSKVSSTIEINSYVTETNTVPGNLATVAVSKKQTLSSVSPTSEGNGVTALTDDKSVESTTTIVSSVIVINSTVTKPSTQTSTLASISANENTVPSIITTSETKESTDMTGATYIASDNSKVSSTIEINSSVTEVNTILETLETVASSNKLTLSPISPTSDDNEATAITSDKFVESTTSKVSSITEINSNVTEPNTKIGTLTIISASKNTVTPIISTSGTKGATAITDDKSIESTTSVVSNTTELNSTVTEANTEYETLATVASSKKHTLSSVSPTSEGNGATAITHDKSVESTTSKVHSITEINSTVTEPNTKIGTLTIISASKNTVTPIISTSGTKGATAITDDKSVESTTSVVLNITEINSTVTEANIKYETLATVASSNKLTLSPISPTSDDNEATAITSDKFVESTTSKVSSITEINSNVTEPNTKIGTLTIISASKNTVTPIISTSGTKGATAITDDKSIESTTSVVSNTTEINSTVTEANTEYETLATVASSKKHTLSSVSPTSEGNGATAITDDKSVESTTSKVHSITEINSTVTEPNTKIGTLTIISASKNTVTPIISTSGTKGATAITDDKSVESTTSVVLNITEINSTVTEANTKYETLATVASSKKHTLSSVSPTSAGNGATAITDDKSVKSTTSKVSSITEINSTVTEPNTETGTIATISASKNTVPPIISTSGTKGATAITDDKSVESTTSVVSIITEINSTVTEANTETETLASVAFSKKHTLSSVSPTSEGNGAIAITDDKSVESTTSKVHSITEINSTVTEPNTKIGTLTIISASKNTVTPIISTSGTKGATAITDDKSVESTTSVVLNITEINSTVTEANTEYETLATVASSKKHTLSSVSPTSAGNGATAITDDKSVKSTTSKVSSITEINSTVTEPNTETGTIATISASKNTVPPIISTSGTKGATAITDDKSIESTTSVVSIITEINSTVTEANTETETLASVATSKNTVPPIISTSGTKGATAITDDKSVESTTSVVSIITESNSTVTKANAKTETLTTVALSKEHTPAPSSSTSETNLPTSMSGDASVELDLIEVSSITEIYSMVMDLKTVPVTLGEDATSEQQTLSPISPTSEANGSTFMTRDTSVESDNSKVSSTKEINTSVTEANTITGTFATIAISNKETVSKVSPSSENTVPSIISTSETKESTNMTSTTSVESDNYKVSSTIEINSSVTEANTILGTLATVASSKPQTLSPISPTSETNGATFVTHDTSEESSTSKVSSITEIYTIATDLHIVPGTLTTAASSKKRKLSPINPTSQGNGVTAITDDKSVESTTSKVSGITKINLTVTEPKTETGTLASKNTIPPVISTSEINGATAMIDETSVESGTSKVTIITETNLIVTEPNTLSDTPAKISADLSQNTEITKQEKEALHNKQTLSPIPITSNVPCPYLTTSEVPTEPQLPDCRISDNFVYPDLVNCNYYYNCFNGIMQRLHCKPSFGFNPHLMICIPEEYAKCGLYKSAADQKTFLISFLLFNHMRKKTEYELNINKYNLNL